MIAPLRHALSILALAALGACSSFTGKEADGGAADMATVDAATFDSAVVDAGDAGVVDAGAPTKLFPPVGRCNSSDALWLATDARGVFLRTTPSDMPTTEPYCVCTPETAGAPPGWAVCAPGQTIESCRTDNVCPATTADRRAYACDFERLDAAEAEGRPSCSSMQYSVERVRLPGRGRVGATFSGTPRFAMCHVRQRRA